MNLILLPSPSEGKIQLQGPAAKHALEVLRVKLGDTLRVGLLNVGVATAEVVAVSKTEVYLERMTNWEAVEIRKAPRLIMGLPRPKAFRRLLKQAVMLGYKEIHICHSFRVEKSYWGSPLLSEEVVREEIFRGLELARDVHWPKFQSHRYFKPFFEDVVSEWVRSEGQGVVAHPYAENYAIDSDLKPSCIALGPEGGWIQYELDLMSELGIESRSFSPRVLSCETALPYVSAVLGVGAH